MNMPSLAEGAVKAAQEVEGLDKSKTAAIADQFHTVEEQLEDDYGP